MIINIITEVYSNVDIDSVERRHKNNLNRKKKLIENIIFLILV